MKYCGDCYKSVDKIIVVNHDEQAYHLCKHCADRRVELKYNSKNIKDLRDEKVHRN